MLNQQIQNYKIISLLGEGGMAYVYLAEHVKLNKKVAVKVLKDNFIRNGNIRNRFIAEAKSLAEINHPNVIKVFDFIEEDRLIAFVMEYISGSTLGKLIEKKGKFKDVEIDEIFSQMLRSIKFIHDKGLIHRDIKPSNFMVKSDGTLILLDFGIAKHLEQVNGEYTETGEFHIMGTPIYMSLEQFGSTKNVTQSSDIYCLGLVLWLMITGKQPFIINEKIDIIELLKRKEKKLPLTKTKWDAIIQPMTQPNVSNRIKTCYEINKLLENQKPTTKNSLFISILIKIIFQFKEKVSKVDEKMINVLGVKIHFLIKLVIFVIVVIAMNQFFSTYFTENK